MEQNEKWLQWAVELQFIAQSALHYCKDRFDIQRFKRVREIAAEIIRHKSDIPPEKVRDLFCSETGYQTPKLDCRAAIFRNGGILLVRERDGMWALPGGWVDAGMSVKDSVIKEAREESGLVVTADRIIAVQDREKHNRPIYAYKICKIFVLCTAVGGAFEENPETTAADFFRPDALPPLALEKNNEEQIGMCFDAYLAKHWETQFD